MKIFRKAKDEREKFEIMRISSIAFWITLWGLLISIIIKFFILDLDLVDVATEFIILIVCTIYIVIASYYRGIWDNKTNPGLKTYLLFGFLIAFVTSILISLIYYLRHETLLESLRLFGIGFIAVFISVSITLALFGTFIRKRQKKLADKYADNDTTQEL